MEICKENKAKNVLMKLNPVWNALLECASILIHMPVIVSGSIALTVAELEMDIH